MKTLFFWIILLVLLLSSNASNAQNGMWAIVPQYDGHYIDYCILDSAGNIYNYSPNGFDRSTDFGLTWSKINTNVLYEYEGMATGNEGTLYRVNTPQMQRSTDAGLTWETYGGYLEGAAHVSVFCISPSGPFFVGTYEGRNFRSDDFGEHWTQLNQGEVGDTILSMAFLPSGKIVAGTMRGINVSSDNGDTWNHATEQDDDVEIRGIAVTKEGNVLAATYGRGVLRSEDDGAHWAVTYDPPAFDRGNIFSVTALRNGNILAGSRDNGIRMSKDDGKTWEGLNHGLVDTVNTYVLGESRLGTVLMTQVTYILEPVVTPIISLYRWDANAEVQERSVSSSDNFEITYMNGNVVIRSIMNNGGSNRINRAEVFDVVGRLVESVDPSADGSEVVISKHQLGIGIYFCRVTTPSESIIQSVVVK